MPGRNWTSQPLSLSLSLSCLFSGSVAWDNWSQISRSGSEEKLGMFVNRAGSHARGTESSRLDPSSLPTSLPATHRHGWTLNAGVRSKNIFFYSFVILFPCMPLFHSFFLSVSQSLTLDLSCSFFFPDQVHLHSVSLHTDVTHLKINFPKGFY